MSYIIVWRNCHREPFVGTDSEGFIEEYPTFEKAKEEAEKVDAAENKFERSQWYFDFKIYKLATS